MTCPIHATQPPRGDTRMSRGTTITLKEMKAGEAGTVAGYAKGATRYREKLLAMGLTRGTTFRVVRIAPMGDPVEILLRGFALSLRKDEASALIVERGERS